LSQCGAFDSVLIAKSAAPRAVTIPPIVVFQDFMGGWG
jgi:hypothetical protein